MFPHFIHHPFINTPLIVHWYSCIALDLPIVSDALDQQHTNQNKTPNDGYLGSRNDEERSEMRYAVRIAEFSESSEL